MGFSIILFGNLGCMDLVIIQILIFHYCSLAHLTIQVWSLLGIYDFHNNQHIVTTYS